MQVLRDPLEAADLAFTGFSTSGNMTTSSTVLRLHKGQGGSRSWKSSVSGAVQSQARSPGFGNYRHLHCKLGARVEESVSNWQVYLLDGLNVGAIRLESLDLGVWQLYRGTTLIASAAVTPIVNTWHLIEFEVYQHASAGWIRVWADNVLIIDFVGNTLQAGTTLSKLQLRGNDTALWDDLEINNLTLSYDGGVGGLPVAGETLTDAVTGATAVITEVNGTAVSGQLVLEGWDSTLGNNWGDNGQITSSGTFDALVNAPNAAYKNGLEPNSTRIGNTYVQVISANANGANSGLTGSDGNQINNYLQVDNRVTVDPPVDYNEATLVNQKDTYKGDFAGLLPAAVGEISSVSLVIYAQSSLTGIDGVVPVTRVGGVDYDGSRRALTANNVLHTIPIPLDPSLAAGVDQSWLLSTLTNATFEYGLKFVV